MNGFSYINFHPVQLAFTVTAVMWGSSLLVCAGEALIFPTEKPKPTTSKASKYGEESSRPWLNAPVQPPGETRPRVNAPRDPKLERRLQKAKEEKENWMIVNKGQLQDEDDDTDYLGVRDGGKKFLEKDGKRSIFFDREALKSEKSDSSAPMSSRPPNAPARLPANPQDQPAKPADYDAEDRDIDIKSKAGRELSAHTSADLTLGNELLGSRKAGEKTPNAGNAENEFKELFQADPTALKSREQKAQREEFQKFLDTPVGLAPSTAFGDPGKSRPDAMRPPVAPPVSGSPLDFSALKNGAVGDTSLRASGKSFDSFNRPVGAGDRPGLNSSLDRPGISSGPQSSPFQQAQPTSPGLRSRSSFDQPLRVGVGGR